MELGAEEDGSVLVAFNEDATMWNSYIGRELVKRKLVKDNRHIVSCPQKGDGSTMWDTPSSSFKRDCHIVVISPNLLDTFDQTTSESGEIFSQSFTGICLLCGVGEEEFTPATQMSLNQYFKTNKTWKMCSSSEAETFWRTVQECLKSAQEYRQNNKLINKTNSASVAKDSPKNKPKKPPAPRKPNKHAQPTSESKPVPQQRAAATSSSVPSKTPMSSEVDSQSTSENEDKKSGAPKILSKQGFTYGLKPAAGLPTKTKETSPQKDLAEHVALNMPKLVERPEKKKPCKEMRELPIYEESPAKIPGSDRPKPDKKGKFSNGDDRDPGNGVMINAFPNIIISEEPTAVVLVSNTALQKGTYTCRLESDYEMLSDLGEQLAIWLNPYTLTFFPPECPPGEVQLTLQHRADNDKVSAVFTLVLTYHSPISTTRNLLQMHLALLEETMDQTEKASHTVDSRLCQRWDQMMNNTEIDDANKLFHMYNPAGVTGMPTLAKDCSPSLLHLASRHGLRGLCHKLLKLPNAIQGCCMQDNQGRRPSDLARMKGMEDVVRAMDNQKLDQKMPHSQKDQPGNMEDDNLYLDMGNVDSKGLEECDDVYENTDRELPLYLIMRDEQPDYEQTDYFGVRATGPPDGEDDQDDYEEFTDVLRPVGCSPGKNITYPPNSNAGVGSRNNSMFWKDINTKVATGQMSLDEANEILKRQASRVEGREGSHDTNTRATTSGKKFSSFMASAFGKGKSVKQGGSATLALPPSPHRNASPQRVESFQASGSSTDDRRPVPQLPNGASTNPPQDDPPPPPPRLR